MRFNSAGGMYCLVASISACLFILIRENFPKTNQDLFLLLNRQNNTFLFLVCALLPCSLSAQEFSETREIRSYIDTIDGTLQFGGKTSYPSIKDLTLVAPIDIDGDGADEALHYTLYDDGNTKFEMMSAAASPRVLHTQTAWNKWSHIIPLEVDGNGGDEILYFSPDQLFDTDEWEGWGSVSFYDVNVDGTQRELRNQVAWKRWTKIVPIDIDGDGTDEIMFYSTYPLNETDDWKGWGTLQIYDIDSNLKMELIHSQVAWRNWEGIDAGDVDGDNNEELIFFALPNQGQSDPTRGLFEIYDVASTGKLSRLYAQTVNNDWTAAMAGDTTSVVQRRNEDVPVDEIIFISGLRKGRNENSWARQAIAIDTYSYDKDSNQLIRRQRFVDSNAVYDHIMVAERELPADTVVAYGSKFNRITRPAPPPEPEPEPPAPGRFADASCACNNANDRWPFDISVCVIPGGGTRQANLVCMSGVSTTESVRTRIPTRCALISLNPATGNQCVVTSTNWRPRN